MRIFLSYPRKNTDKAKQLQAALTQGGHTVWMDDQLITGQPWRTQLENQIKQADAIALALTPHWVSSPYCNWEFITAVENNKPVIPVVLVKAQLPDHIRQYQYADLSAGFDSATVQKLLNDLHTLSVSINNEHIAHLDKEAYAMSIDQNNQDGNNVNASGDGNTVAGGNIDQRNQSFNIGSLSGGNINLGGTQTIYGNVTFNAGQAGTAEDEKAQLQALIHQLNDAIKQLPPADAEVIESLAQDAVNEASKDNPNRRLLEIKGESLKQAAQNLAAVAPIVAKIVQRLLTFA
jgi:hypothetical protein